MRAHFFDIDTLILLNNQPWIVSKDNPNVPIMKISQSDFNLSKNGIYKSQGNKIELNGKVFWLSSDLMNKLKIKAKNSKVDISRLSISMQEFLNKELIDNLDFKLNMDILMPIKNTNDDIYIVCSKNSKVNYEGIISKFEDKLKDNGLVIKNYYFISETFYNRNSDETAYKKARLLLQHLVGYKTDGNKFIDEELERYNEIFYYDDDIHSLSLIRQSNKIFQVFLSKTESVVKSKIKDSVKSGENIIHINELTSNIRNKFITSKVVIEYSNLIKAFESFRNSNL
jgi:hypothetical protein